MASPLNSRQLRRLPAVVALLAAAAFLPWLLRIRQTDQRRVVIYCAHDAIFADRILKAFEQQSGITVDVRYDEEASKSLGLTSLLSAEKNQPRCDVFWNNQTLGTMRLKSEGVLEPCDPELFARIPAKFRDPDHCWCGFAARLRVWMVNTERMPATREAVTTALQGDSLSQMAIAVPLFGTTLTHYTVLCAELGLEGLKAWHDSLHARGVREARGNGAVRDLVAEGACAFGLTDTDDAFASLDAGKPVGMFPVQLDDGRTICIPNSVAVIRNCPHPDEARELVHFLLSEQTELALAGSASRQIPLGPVDQSKLTTEVLDLIDDAERGYPLQQAEPHDREVLQWLQGHDVDK